MPAPALKIPVAVDLDAFKDGMNKASSHVGQVVKLIGSQFEKLNAGIAAGSTAGAAGIASGYAGAAARVVGSFGLMAAGAGAAALALAGAIHEARQQLEEMVAIADKARDRGVGAEFFQKFLLSAKDLKVTAADLEKFLSSAFSNTREKSPIDLSKWEAADERITGVELALRVYNVEAKKAGQQLEGLVLFRDAETQEQKVLAVVKAMVQLNSIGKTLESLELGEKLFGQTFVDNVRKGNTSAEQLLKTLQAAASEVPFSNELVKRAKDIDDELKKAHQTLEKNLRPAWDGLASVALDIKNLWVRIVQLMGDAAGALSFFGPAAELKRLKGDLENVNKALAAGTALYGVPALSGTERILTARKAELEALIKAAEPSKLPQITVNSRGTGAAPSLKDDRESARDRFERAADSIEKRTAAVEAETAAIDLGTEARNRAKISAELETVAKQINKEAGLGANVVTEEQTRRIDEVAAAYGRAAAAIEQARSPLAAFGRESANVGLALNRFAAGSLDNLTNEMAAVVVGTRSVKEAFNSLATSIIQDLARITIRQTLTGPLATFLNQLGGGTGGIFNVNGGTSGGTGLPGYGGLFAEGGTLGAGKWGIAGENGPEIIKGPAQIVPSNITSKMSGVNIEGASITINAPGADAAGLARVEVAVVQLNRSIEGRALRAFKDARSRRVI